MIKLVDFDCDENHDYRALGNFQNPTKGSAFANFAICILFVWALSFIAFAIVTNVNSELATYPALVAMLAGGLGAFVVFILDIISCIKNPRK